jgi:hypothetical protein
MATSARFGSKDPKSQFSGCPNENFLDYIQEYKLAIREYYLSPSMQKVFSTSSSSQVLSLSVLSQQSESLFLRSTMP